MLVKVVDKKRVYNCQDCYCESVMDDPEDHRASRGVNGGADVELSISQYRKDKDLNEGRPFRTKKAMARTALN